MLFILVHSAKPGKSVRESTVKVMHLMAMIDCVEIAHAISHLGDVFHMPYD